MSDNCGSPESAMSQKEIAEETKRKLDELEQKIRAAKTSPGAPEQIVGAAHKDWQAMVDSHAAISRKLNELEQQIRAARGSLSAQQIANETHKDWEDMLASHAAISRKLDAADDHPAEVLEGIRLDVDVLCNSFERWMARVEGNYAKGTKGS